ncbi:MAG: class I SAM-dependent methyltransferase [Candidatus Omnitrophota bacterium]
MFRHNKKMFYNELRKEECGDVVDFGPLARLRRRIILDMLKIACGKNSRILDTGCGRGNLLFEMDRAGFFNLEGSDFSEESLAISKQKFTGRLFRADLTNLRDFASGGYDAVICSEVLEHIEDDISAMRNLNSLLKPGGILIISAPFNPDMWSEQDDFAGHVRRYSEGEAEEKLRLAGFMVENIRFSGWLLSEVYHKTFMRNDPAAIRSAKNRNLKRIISSVLYYPLLLESPVRSTRLARRLFILARRPEGRDVLDKGA